MNLKLFQFAFLVLVVCNVSAQNKKALSISHLVDNFYIYTTYQDYGGSPYPSNSMYLVTEAGVVLFDTPWDKTQLQPLLDSIMRKHQKKVVICIATHFHADRTGGFDYYKQKGIKTYSSSLTQSLCKEHGEPQAEFTFNRDTIFAIGGYSFTTFYPGPGHTKDNIVIWFEKERLLYGGCFVKSTETASLGNLQDANLASWPDAIEKVLASFSNPKYVIPGHLDWSNNKSLEHTLDLLKTSKASAEQ